MLAERFHTSPALLAQLNRGVPMTAGKAIKVPAVTPFDVRTPNRFATRPADITIQVSREESALRATRADGTLVFFAPVSSGSVHDPLPPGDWKVTGVACASGVSLQPGSVLGREAEGRKGDDQGRPEQPGRRRLGRAQPRALRAPRHA